jgi:hypothetical protein
MIALLPLTPNSLLNGRKAKLKVFFLLTKIISEAIEALEAYLNKNYAAFDAQVGETACQIRAYKICLLATDSKFYKAMHHTLRELIAYKLKVHNLSDTYIAQSTAFPSYLKNIDQKETLLDFFKKYSLKFFADNDFKFVILSFFLKKYCLTDINRIPNAINYKMIQASWEIGSTPARNIANHYQSLLSKLSCNFLFALSDNHSSKKNIQLLENLLKTGDRNRFALPYYDGTKILIHSLLTSNLPVILSITRTSKIRREKNIFLFKKENGSAKFSVQTKSEQYKSDTPCVVFRGSVDYQDKPFESAKDYLKRLLHHSLESIILMNAAAHPQYTGQTLETYRTEPYKDMMEKSSNTSYLQKQAEKMDVELKQYQQLARAQGCTQKNTSLFYIEHIFCDLIKNEATKSVPFSKELSLTTCNPLTLKLTTQPCLNHIEATHCATPYLICPTPLAYNRSREKRPIHR